MIIFLENEKKKLAENENEKKKLEENENEVCSLESFFAENG